MLVGFIVIFALLVLATAATHFIPAGTYRRQSRIDERTGSTLEVVVPDSFQYTDANPQGLLAFLYSPVKSLYYQGPVGAIIVVFILLVGGAFTAIRRTGALDSGIAAFIHGMKGREPVVLIYMMLVFSLFGSLLGLLEELVPFVLIVASLAAAMGYDAVVGVMMIFGACAVGFTAAMMNPFTLGVAQALAGLPMFSGLLFRLIVWIVMLGIAVATEGRIIDTVLSPLASVVTRFTSILASWAMLIIQTALNFFIPSGSAQGVVSMPVMIPLGELAGITRQSAVLAFQMGDGFSNMLWPTNPTLIVALALAGVPWTRWARFMVPLQLLFLAAGFATLAAAVAIGWGAF
jgi:uncharacterized ion transporter superfamily protein YfcC